MTKEEANVLVSEATEKLLETIDGVIDSMSVVDKEEILRPFIPKEIIANPGQTINRYFTTSYKKSNEAYTILVRHVLKKHLPQDCTLLHLMEN